jgi:hypothetical protein
MGGGYYRNDVCSGLYRGYASTGIKWLIPFSSWNYWLPLVLLPTNETGRPRLRCGCEWPIPTRRYESDKETSFLRPKIRRISHLSPYDHVVHAYAILASTVSTMSICSSRSSWVYSFYSYLRPADFSRVNPSRSG